MIFFGGGFIFKNFIKKKFKKYKNIFFSIKFQNKKMFFCAQNYFESKFKTVLINLIQKQEYLLKDLEGIL